MNDWPNKQTNKRKKLILLILIWKRFLKLWTCEPETHTRIQHIHSSIKVIIFKLEVVISEKSQSMIHTHTLTKWMINSSQWRSKYMLRTDQRERRWKHLNFFLPSIPIFEYPLEISSQNWWHRFVNSIH